MKNIHVYPGCYCYKFFYDFGVDCLSLDILHVTIWYVYARLNQMHQSFWILYLVGIFFVNMNTTTYLHYLFLLEISATLEMNHNVAVWKFLLHTYITRFLYINYMFVWIWILSRHNYFLQILQNELKKW